MPPGSADLRNGEWEVGIFFSALDKYIREQLDGKSVDKMAVNWAVNSIVKVGGRYCRSASKVFRSADVVWCLGFTIGEDVWMRRLGGTRGPNLKL